jgi:hypothetical protein
MKQLLLLLLSGWLLMSCAPQIYKSANFDTIKQTQEVVAVLPFDATFDPRRLPRGIRMEELDKVSLHTSYALQQHAYYYLLNRTYIKNYCRPVNFIF